MACKTQSRLWERRQESHGSKHISNRRSVTEWGLALFKLKPHWHHLDRWIRQSKLHCLAAIDALFFSTDPHGGGDARQIPEGADSKSINDAIDFALAHYGNPRLEKAAKEIRHAWPKGRRKRHAI